ncbi:MAG: dihydroorotate dehydrogenase electron transfer subunit [Chloroflexota bacterium]
MKLGSARVLSNEPVMAETRALRLEAPWLSGAQPGQFVHVRAGATLDPLLRRPISVYRVHPDGVSILVRAVGVGTQIIASRQEGSELDILGPLGQPFSVDAKRTRFFLVGGGYGVAPMVALTDQLLARGADVVLAVGARTAEHVYPAGLVPSAAEYQIATMDGSLGHEGVVTDLLREGMEWAEAVYACGPTPMLAAAHGVVQEFNRGRGGLGERPIQVAMEQHMGCAMGVCLGCVIRTRRGFERVCRDGPVFSGGDVLWDAVKTGVVA